MHLEFFILGLLYAFGFQLVSGFFFNTWTSRNFSTVLYDSTTFGYVTPALVHSTARPCHGDTCKENLFICANKQIINSSLVCNRVNDCSDGSDESRCDPWQPKITVLPKRKIELFCGDQDELKSGVLELECTFVGYPEPLVKWKKYEGHVPSKCQQTSSDGKGKLTCPYFQQSDQGAYSCVAENSKGSAESQPKSIAKCSNRIYCNGFIVKSEEEIENCLECFCSGKTSYCKNIASDLAVIEMPFPTTKTEVFAINNGEIVFIPSDTDLAPDQKLRRSSQEITYCSLSKKDFKETSFLKSYGRNINIPRQNGKLDFMTDAPDLIIRGNGIALMYKFNLISHSAKAVDIRFWPGNWHHLDKVIAKRRDLMKVLANMDTILFRCEYIQNKILNIKDKILIESSRITDFNNSISYVEKCTCPTGYSGLSCEICAPGYKLKAIGNDFKCEKIIIKCPEGRIGDRCEECDKSKNYFPSNGTCVKKICNAFGSASLDPNFKGKCTCHENVEGDSCDRCKHGYFSLRDKCLKCWCSGVTVDCQSSNWYKSVTSSPSLGGYNSSDGRNFWLLSSMFAGNLLTSYSGHLNYSMAYSFDSNQSSLKPLTVELLTIDDITLFYTHSIFSSIKSWSVNLMEKYWQKSDKSSVTREEFLDFLTRIKAMYIESPYHLSSGKVNLTSVRMSSATAIGDEDDERAWAVEQCRCPPGYIGLSCEKCAENYYRSKNNISQSVCRKCDCENCHPELGCLDCPVKFYRSNPESEPRPICKPCPCSNNEIKCHRDSYNQIVCICQPGFLGIFCEIDISDPSDNFVIVAMSPRKVTNRTVGSTFKFNCSYVSDEDMNVVIKKSYTKREKLQVERVEERPTDNAHGMANIFEIVLEYDLEYVECLVYNKGGKKVGHVLSEINLIKVVKPVKITNCNSDTINIVEKEDWDLICEATGIPTPIVTWFRTTSKSYMEKVPTIDGVHYIKSEETTLNKNGTIYSCIAENSEGSKDKCTQVLTLRKKCETVHVIPKKVIVEEGETIVIQCKTSANSSVSWSRLKSDLPRFRHNVTNGELKISQAEINDSGIYICKVKTDTGYINDTALVEVQEKRIPISVTILHNDITLKTGENYVVTCEASGKPTPTITWTKEKGNFPLNVVADNEVLNIKGAVTENTGIYKCTGRSEEKEAVAFILITVEENRVKPQVAIDGTGLTKVIAGQTLNLLCAYTKGIPPPTLEWLKKSPNAWDSISHGGTLKLKNITVHNAGDYKCKGKNSAGEDEQFTKIDVLIPPRVNISAEEISVQDGEVVSIECLAIGYPKPNISWLGPLLSTLKTSNGSRISSPILIHPLESAKDQISFMASKIMDASNISCIAANEAGRAQISAKLNILQPRREDVIHVVEFVQIGSYFELSCHPLTGNVIWRKENGHIEGDVCRGANGLIIPSVQIQHGGNYSCTLETIYESKTKKVTINVVGFAPKFNQVHRSYMILPVTLKLPHLLQVQISFRAAAENGLLLQKRENEFNLYLKKSKIHLFLHPIKGDSVNVQSNVIIEQNKWYSLGIIIRNSNLDITVYDEKSIIIDKIQKNFNNFDMGLVTEDEFSVGGSFPRNRMAPHSRRSLFMHIHSFEGCISRLTIDSQEFNIVANGSYSRNVSQCAMCSESEDPCQGKGKCFNAPTQYGFLCVCPTANGNNNSCPASCSKKGCETRLNLCQLINPCKSNLLHKCLHKSSSLECHCAYGYEGATCNRALEYSFCVKGDGFVKLPSRFLDRQSLQVAEEIEIKFVFQKANGLLLWQGDTTNHLFIAVRDSQLEYVYLNQGYELFMRGNLKLPLNQKITMKVSRRNNTVQMYVDSPSGFDHLQNSTMFTTNRVNGDIYLGNLPNTVYGPKLLGLSGCIKYIKFGNKTKVNFFVDALERTNTLNKQKLQYALPKDLDRYSDESNGSDNEDESDED